MVVLNPIPVRHDQDAVCVDDCRQSVSDDDHRSLVVLQLLTQLGLNEVISLQVNVGGGFIQHENFRSEKHGPGQTQKLLLASREQG